MVYLGSTVHANGKFGCEISRKIGAASAEFKIWHRIWKNSALPLQRKLHIFDVMILSKLRYSCACAWLSKSELRRLDGFEAACLRKVLRIRPAFSSRVSNAAVREIAQREPFSALVRSAQLKLLEQVLHDPCKQVLKEVAFHRGNPALPETSAFIRKVGRPRHNWTDQLMSIMRQSAGSS